MGRAYYNEIDRDAAHVLRALIADDVIAPGDVDERSIKDVQADDVDGYTQCHFFAGGGLWSVAARLAGWPDDRPLWTGSCPCQPFSVAGKGAGTDDQRHLWPDFFRLIRAVRPTVVMGEQVAGAAGRAWFDGVSADLEGSHYACRAVDVPACAVDAPHIRQRLYWLADTDKDGRQRLSKSHKRATAGQSSPRWYHFERRCSYDCVADADNAERRAAQPGRHVDHGPQTGRNESHCHLTERRSGSFWSDHEWRTGADGKARRVKPGLRLLVDGLPGRVGLLRIGGNAISPIIAAEVIGAYLDLERTAA